MDRVDVGGGLDTKYFKPPETRQTLVKELLFLLKYLNCSNPVVE